MNKPTPVERVDDVLTAIRSIKKFISETTREGFLDDSQLQSAVMFQFLIIGEAIRHIDNSILDKYPYPWHIPASFRNFIIHEYRRIKMERIYDAANDLSDLENVIMIILKNEF